MGRRHLVEDLLVAGVTKAVQPTALLSLAPQHLCLPLNREVNEKGSEFQKGLAVHTDAVNAPATADPSATTIESTGHHQR